MCYVADETEKLGIRNFEEINRSLSKHLFDGEELTAAEQEMLDYILSSGAYGTAKHSIQNKMRKRGWSKLQYVLHRFLVPVNKSNPDYRAYSKQYPTWYRYKILLLVLPVAIIRKNMVIYIDDKKLRRKTSLLPVCYDIVQF